MGADMSERRYVRCQEIPQPGTQIVYNGYKGKVVCLERYTSWFTGPDTAVMEIRMFDGTKKSVLASRLGVLA